MRHICFQCEVELRPYKNGVLLTEMAGPRPYKIWSTDILKCPSCHTAIFVTAERPFSAQGEKAFDDLVEASWYEWLEHSPLREVPYHEIIRLALRYFLVNGYEFFDEDDEPDWDCIETDLETLIERREILYDRKKSN